MTSAGIENLINTLNQRYQDTGDSLIRSAADALAAQQGRGEGPKRVVLCGSSRFVDVMAVCAWLIERDENAIAMSLHLLPQWYPDVPDHHLAEAEGVAARMDELHLRKIDLADEVFVVNVEHYIGISTTREVEYAMRLGKPIRWFTDDSLGHRVNMMLSAAKLAQESEPGHGWITGTADTDTMNVAAWKSEQNAAAVQKSGRQDEPLGEPESDLPAPAAAPSNECICPKCGIRHGGSNVQDPGF